MRKAEVPRCAFSRNAVMVNRNRGNFSSAYVRAVGTTNQTNKRAVNIYHPHHSITPTLLVCSACVWACVRKIVTTNKGVCVCVKCVAVNVTAMYVWCLPMV